MSNFRTVSTPRTRYMGAHVGCGGPVYYTSTNSYGRRWCLTCGADGSHGRTSPDVFDKPLEQIREENPSLTFPR